MSASKLLEQLGEQRRKVDFDTYDITVQQLLSMLGEGVINIAPAYQRLYRWKDDRQSGLIESLFLGIPVPNLFMATDRDGTWEVVDGVQRLSTLVRFAGTDQLRERIGIKNRLNISGLDKLTELRGTFDSLPSALQLQFMLRPVKVVTLSDKSDMAVRFDLFERLNTGGIALTNQEIRSCIFRGTFDDFLDELATTDDFKRVVLLPSQAELDGSRQELVLRFFAFLNNFRSFEHSVVDFLNEYMKDATKHFDYQSGRREFERTFAFLAREVPQGLIGKAYKTPISLYEGITVGTALAFREQTALREDQIYNWSRSDEMRGYGSGATNDKNKVRKRIEQTRDILIGKRDVQ